MAVASKAVLPIFSILLGLNSISWSQNQTIDERIQNIFLSKSFNSTESEWILTSARESYQFLKSSAKQPADEEKLNFVKNYANFLLKLLREVQTEEIDAHHIFLKENSFLKELSSSESSQEFNVTELRSEIMKVQFIAEQHLITHRNTSNRYYNAVEVLALNKTSFDVFLKEKLRADYSEIGYFFLETFATLISLSWGIISTVLYVTHPVKE